MTIFFLNKCVRDLGLSTGKDYIVKKIEMKYAEEIFYVVKNDLGKNVKVNSNLATATNPEEEEKELFKLNLNHQIQRLSLDKEELISIINGFYN